MDGTGTEVAPILLLVAQWYRGTGAVHEADEADELPRPNVWVFGHFPLQHF
jgi:hypothetical protein